MTMIMPPTNPYGMGGMYSDPMKPAMYPGGMGMMNPGMSHGMYPGQMPPGGMFGSMQPPMGMMGGCMGPGMQGPGMYDPGYGMHGGAGCMGGMGMMHDGLFPPMHSGMHPGPFPGVDLAAAEHEGLSLEDLNQRVREQQEGELLERFQKGMKDTLPPMPDGVEELKLVQAWRPTLAGMRFELGVIHRVHHEDRTVTVQFFADQQRARVPVSAVRPELDITPTYKKMYLLPGEKPPNRAEQEAAWLAELQCRQQGVPLPPELAQFAPIGEEVVDEETPPEESRTIHVDRWGIPATTLEALRNRSIPTYKVSGVYNKHFYSNLYRTNFFHTEGHIVSDSGHVGVDEDGEHGMSFHVRGQGNRNETGMMGMMNRLKGNLHLGAGGGGGGNGWGGLGNGCGGGGGFQRPDLVAPGVLIGGEEFTKPVLLDPSKLKDGMLPDGSHVVSHHYVPLVGKELEQDLKNGRWYPLTGAEIAAAEMPEEEYN